MVIVSSVVDIVAADIALHLLLGHFITYTLNSVYTFIFILFDFVCLDCFMDFVLVLCLYHLLFTVELYCVLATVV